jgi:hypothetical protein
MHFNDTQGLMREASSILTRSSRTALRAAIAGGLLATACALGGCAGSGAAADAYAMAGNSTSAGPTVAFDSIDGPPPRVFDQMVSVLDSESKLRNLVIVSREGQASYRVRSYLAAQVDHGKAEIAWVWDVYDANHQRALRLSGEEPAGNAGRDAWSAADDLVLRKIAQAGFSGLTAMVNGTTPDQAVPPAVGPGKDGPAVASAEPTPPASADSMGMALGYAGR